MHRTSVQQPRQQPERRSSRRHSARTVLPTTTLVLMLAMLILATLAGPAPADAQSVAGTSDAGIVPVVIGSDRGGNVACADIPGGELLTSSERMEWRGRALRPAPPAGIDVTVTAGTSVAWTATFPVTAVIVKGGDAANVYVYDPMRLADGGLVAPVNASGQPADLSNLTFCWDEDPPGVDLLAVCLAAALALEVGPIVSFVGPVLIRDGGVDATTVPDDVTVAFDPSTDRVGFAAPFPVVVVVTAASDASDPVLHPIAPPSTTGSVPFASNPGDGAVVLCGLDTPVDAAASCAQVEADAELGPVRVVSGEPSTLPTGVEVLSVDGDIIVFEASVPVVGLVVEASDPTLYGFPVPVLAGEVPVVLGDAEEFTLMFCVRSVLGGGGGGDPVPASEQESGVVASADPVLIPTGGGPAGRVPLALVAFVALALTGTTTLLRWSRGG
jgi:hypothetical protein